MPRPGRETKYRYSEVIGLNNDRITRTTLQPRIRFTGAAGTQCAPAVVRRVLG